MLNLDSVSLFIPTFNAEPYLALMFQTLICCGVKKSNIIIVDSSSSDKTSEICFQFDIRIHSIQRNEFNHGKTRNLCLKLCDSNFIVFMTQDALPCNRNFLKELLIPFEDDLVASTYARQIPRLAAKPLEKLDRDYKYPDYNIIQSQDTISELGSRAYFLSNSCAAYRISTFRELGGFPEDKIMGEDAIFAYKAISKGFKIVYASKSEVYHSHDYTFQELFKRYFDTGVYRSKALAMPKQIEGKTDVGQGSSYAKQIISSLIKTKQYSVIPVFILNLIFSFLGYALGQKYYLIPNFLRIKLSMHSFYWRKEI